MIDDAICFHATGMSRFIDDEPEPIGLLHAAVVTSPLAHGRIRGIHTRVARSSAGVAAVLTAADIPGINQVGEIIPDEPLLATEEVVYVGQPVALVLADTPEQARQAARLARLDIEPRPALFDARTAAAAGSVLEPPRTLASGDVDATWSRCAVIVEDRVDSGAQEHLYLETQIAMAWPLGMGGIKVLAGTQSPTAVQSHVAEVLGLGMHAVEVEVRRIGGGFGGKEVQATPWAALAALGAFRSGCPVKLRLSRQEDMRLTGKRHAYSSDFRLGLDESGKILAYAVTFYQNAGAVADLSTSVMEASLLHATGCYYVPNTRLTGICCRTNLPPATACRSYGRSQALYVLECALDQAAAVLGMDRAELQQRNLLDDGQRFPFGMIARRPEARRSFTSLQQRCDWPALRRSIETFNRSHRLQKRGAAIQPIAFGIGFSSTFLNQAGALVNVYRDGTVAVSTGAVDMGQGVNAKIRGIVARTLGVDPARVISHSTDTTRVINTSPTAASSGADLNGMAAHLAAEAIRARLVPLAARELGCRPEGITIDHDQVRVSGRESGMNWSGLVATAYLQRVNLAAQAHYATPDISFDSATGRGDVYAYHVWGAACVEVTLDCLRGTCTVDAVRMVHDAGRSLHEQIDRGQAEGAVVQGLGWVLMEEVLVADDGRLRTDTLSTYKVPDLYFAPAVMDIDFLENAANPWAVLQSKGIGEPPFMYALGAWFALQDAMRAFRPELRLAYRLPLTPERILLALWPESDPVQVDPSPTLAGVESGPEA